MRKVTATMFGSTNHIPIIIILLTISLLVESKKSYMLKAKSPWKNEITKCATGGEDHHTYVFYIGNATALGLNFNDLDALTVVLADGTFKGTMKAAEKTSSLLLLHDYKSGNGFKTYYGEHGLDAVCGWATQRARGHLTAKFLNNGEVELTNYVYAASWGAVSCATAQSFVDSVQIIN